MNTELPLVTIHPYFRPHPGKMDAFKALAHRFIEQTASETGVVYYEFSSNGTEVFCREGYVNAAAVLEHLTNVGPLLEEAMQLAELIRLEFHGPGSELDQLRDPLNHLSSQWFVLECSLRRSSAA